MGNSGPFRGELGEATEGAIDSRDHTLARHIKPNTTTYAMFSIMDFLPTFAHIVGGKMPTDRPIDGVDQTDVLLGNSAMGHRESLLSFIGGDLVAVRWKQWRLYFTDVQPTGIGPQRQPGMLSSNAPMAGYPKAYNIEMDPHEDLDHYSIIWLDYGARAQSGRRYLASVKKYPNPPPPNITQFGSGGHRHSLIGGIYKNQGALHVYHKRMTSDRRLTSVCALLAIGAFALAPHRAVADESGVSFWLPGLFGSLAAVPVQPGLSGAMIYYHTTVSAGGDVSTAREAQIGGSGVTVKANLNANLNANADLALFLPSYTFATTGTWRPGSRELNGSIYGRMSTSCSRERCWLAWGVSALSGPGKLATR